VGGTTPYSKYDEVELFDKATSSHKMTEKYTQNGHPLPTKFT